MINTKVILNTPTIKWFLLAYFTVTSLQYLILLAINRKVMFPGYLKVECMVKESSIVRRWSQDRKLGENETHGSHLNSRKLDRMERSQKGENQHGQNFTKG